MSDQIWDFIVIGGGLNGLAISALLSNDGKKVLVLEKDIVIGGRLKVIEREGFFLDNTSRNLLKYAHKSALNEILQKTSSILEKKIRIKPIKDYYLFLGLEKTKNLKPNTHETKYIDWFNRGWVTVPRNMDQMRHSDYFSSWNLMRIYTTGFKCKYDDIRDKSLNWFINEKKMNENSARYLKLAASALMHCCEPEIVSAGEVLRTIKWTKMPILFGYPEGGWNKVIRKLVKRIESNGMIMTDCGVNNLTFLNYDQGTSESENKEKDNFEIGGVETDKGKFKSKNVILAIPPKSINKLFLGKDGKNFLDTDTTNFINNLTCTSGISFDFALKRWAYRGKGLLYFEDPYGYGIFISNIEPSLAPEKKQLMTAFFPLKPKDLEDEEYIKRKVDDSRNLIFHHFPKVKERLLFERVTVHDMVDSVQINTSQYKDARPKTKVRGIKGCYLTGDYLNAYGAGKELGYNSVWKTYNKIKKVESKSKKKIKK